jgi:uncharacterized protein YqhQ
VREAPIHFEGSIPNASGTPRGEVGGLAVFEGVLMRSRTGFALALRRRDGAIDLYQFPLAGLFRRGHRLPLIRGATSIAEMMLIGTRALRLSAEKAEGRTLRRKRPRLGALLAVSAAMIAVLLVILPSTGATMLLGLTGASFNESESPLLFHLVETLLRLLVLVAYIIAIGLDKDVRRVFAYHGAEHKAVLALEEGRDVTVARARAHDTLHPRCGTTFLALAAVIAGIVFLVCDWSLALHVSGFPDWPTWQRRTVAMACHIALLPLVAGIAFETIKWAARRPRHRVARILLKPGFWLQRLTTRTPNDHQLEVAIVALFGALAIAPDDRQQRHYTVRGLEDDETAPGYVPRSPARPAPVAGTAPAQEGRTTSEETRSASGTPSAT